MSLPDGIGGVPPARTVDAMTEQHLRQNQHHRSTAPTSHLSWAAVLGFGAMALLWPLLHLTGLADVIGEPATGIGTIVLVGLVWVLGAGLADVPRPVATLTLAGVVYGLLLLVLSATLGVRGDVGPLLLGFTAVIEIGRSAALGALAGLLARAIQRGRQPR